MTDKLNLNKSGKVPRLPQLNSSLPKLPTLGQKGAVPSLSANTQAPTHSPSSEANVAVNSTAEAHIPDMNAQQPIGTPIGSPLSSPLASPLSAAPMASPLGAAAPMASPLGAAAPMASPLGAAAPMAPANLDAAITASPMAQPEVPASASMEDDGPVFGGAATSDEVYDEEEGDDAGEKTMMLGAAIDDEEEEDLGGEKTQITMSAMDFDPLSGKLIVESGKAPQREYILVRDKTRIGRAPKNDIAISDISMSREHVEIDKFPEGFRVRDLDSGNGTVLNGYRIRVGQLRNGDIIEVGSIRFKFEQTGGDPDVLWRGEPKIEYHPNQQKKSGGVPSSANMPPSTGGYKPTPSQAPAPQAPQAPQMESMLQRQGGGIAAPSWNGAPSMTSPYMMSYGANALRNVNTTPVWANVVLVALIILCVGSFVWLGFAGMQKAANTTQIAEREEIIKLIDQDVEAAISAYGKQNFSTALDKFNEALERDKDETIIKDREMFNFYKKLITQEEDVNKEIKKIRVKKRELPVSEFEQDLKYLNEVPEDSVNKKLAVNTIKSVNENFQEVLKTQIRNHVNENNLSEAKNLLNKLRALPDTGRDVKQLSKLISDKEKTLN